MRTLARVSPRRRDACTYDGSGEGCRWPVVGLFRTIDDIVGNPHRSRPWKIVDVTVLGVLWILSLVSIAIWLDGNAWSTWSVVVRILPLIALIATAQSWYRHPSPSKEARAKLALETKYLELSRVHGNAGVSGTGEPVRTPGPVASRAEVAYRSTTDLAPRDAISPPGRSVIVLRCTTVQVTGVVWTLVGTGLVLGGLAWLVPLDHRVWVAATAACIAGLVVACTGLTFLQARLEIRHDAIVTYWALAKHSYPMASLVDASLSHPRRRGDRANGPSDWVRPGTNGLVFLSGYMLRLTFRLLAWMAMPGSSSGEVLHLIPRHGGPALVPAISTRVDRRDDSAHHALAMVRAAIHANVQRLQAQRQESLP